VCAEPDATLGVRVFVSLAHAHVTRRRRSDARDPRQPVGCATVHLSFRPHRLARRSTALAAATFLIAAGSALAQVHLSAGSYYSGKSTTCDHPTTPGTRCVFTFRASHGGFALRLVGPTVVSTWECRHGGGEALLGGNASGNVPVPLLNLQGDGTLSARGGSGRQAMSPATSPKRARRSCCASTSCTSTA